MFGYQIDRSAPELTKTVATQDGKAAKSLPAWNVPEMETSAWRYLDLAKSAKYLGGDKGIFNFGEHLGKYTTADGSIDIAIGTDASASRSGCDASTSTTSPDRTRPRWCSAYHAVIAWTGKAAPWEKDQPSGRRRT